MPDNDDDIHAQVARLRAQLDTLVREKVAPAAEHLGERVEAAAHDAAGSIHARAEALAEVIRAQPLTAVAIAAVIGFLAGRAGR